MKKPSLTIFFPFLNDWGTVGSLTILAAQTAKTLTDDWEIIIVNDGSNPSDREALEAVAAQIKGARIVHHRTNQGYGAALRTGFASAKKDLIFYTDCDAQYDVREMMRLVREMDMDDKRLGMVNGYKMKRNDPLHRVIVGLLYQYTIKWAFQLPIRDVDCDFRLIKREVLQNIHLQETTGTICVELVKSIDKSGYRIAEVPVHHYWRTSGKSQFFNFKRVGKTLVALWRLWWQLMVKRK